MTSKNLIVAMIIIITGNLFPQQNISDYQKNWPQFRGPNSNQIPVVKNFPQRWDETANILWKFRLEGKGWSSPIIWEDKLFFTTAVIDEPTPAGGNAADTNNRQLENPSDKVYRLEIYCQDINSGKIIRKRILYKDKPTYRTHRDNTYASETVVTDGKYIYVYFGMMGLYCFDFSGSLIWEKDLGVYKMQSEWGRSTSPLLHGGQLFMQIDNEEESFLTALDPETGKENWRIPRDEGSSWSTPVIWKNKLRTELVTSGGRKARSYNPQNGKLYRNWI